MVDHGRDPYRDLISYANQFLARKFEDQAQLQFMSDKFGRDILGEKVIGLSERLMRINASDLTANEAFAIHDAVSRCITVANEITQQSSRSVNMLQRRLVPIEERALTLEA